MGGRFGVGPSASLVFAFVFLPEKPWRLTASPSTALFSFSLLSLSSSLTLACSLLFFFPFFFGTLERSSSPCGASSPVAAPSAVPSLDDVGDFFGASLSSVFANALAAFDSWCAAGFAFPRLDFFLVHLPVLRRGLGFGEARVALLSRRGLRRRLARSLLLLRVGLDHDGAAGRGRAARRPPHVLLARSASCSRIEGIAVNDPPQLRMLPDRQHVRPALVPGERDARRGERRPGIFLPDLGDLHVDVDARAVAAGDGDAGAGPLGLGPLVAGPYRPLCSARRQHHVRLHRRFLVAMHRRVGVQAAARLVPGGTDDGGAAVAVPQLVATHPALGV